MLFEVLDMISVPKCFHSLNDMSSYYTAALSANHSSIQLKLKYTVAKKAFYSVCSVCFKLCKHLI